MPQAKYSLFIINYSLNDLQAIFLALRLSGELTR